MRYLLTLEHRDCIPMGDVERPMISVAAVFYDGVKDFLYQVLWCVESLADLVICIRCGG
jgi:hypothetical protein